MQGGAVGLLLLLGAVICSGWQLLHNRYLDVACLGRPLLGTDMSEYLFDCWELIDKLRSVGCRFERRGNCARC